MLATVKQNFNNLQSLNVMNQNITTVPQLSQALNQEVQSKNQIQAQLTSASRSLNSIKTQNNMLKAQENTAKNSLTQNQAQVEKINSYLTDFVNNEFEDTTVAGDSIDLNNN